MQTDAQANANKHMLIAVKMRIRSAEEALKMRIRCAKDAHKTRLPCAEDAYIYMRCTPSLPALRQACSQNDCQATMGIDTSSAGAAAVAAVAFLPRLVLRAVADTLALGAASYTNKRSGLDAAFFF